MSLIYVYDSKIKHLCSTSITDGPFTAVQSAQVHNPRARRRNRGFVPKRGFFDKLLVDELQAIPGCGHSGASSVLVDSFDVVRDPLARASRVESAGRDAGVCARATQESRPTRISGVPVQRL